MSVEEIFRLDTRTVEKVSVPKAFFIFGLSLLALSLTTVFNLYFAIRLDDLLAYYQQTGIVYDWQTNIFLFSISKAFLGLSFLLVGVFYTRVGIYLRIPNARSSSSLFTLWGLMHVYDSALLILENPSPDDILASLESIPELYIYLLYIIPILAILLMGYGFVRLPSIVAFSNLIRFSGLILIVGGLLYIFRANIGSIIIAAGFLLASVTFIKESRSG